MVDSVLEVKAVTAGIPVIADFELIGCFEFKRHIGKPVEEGIVVN